MSNMSYCKFQNTLPDLRDCADALYDTDGDLSGLSDEEQRAALALIRLCHDIADDFSEDFI